MKRRTMTALAAFALTSCLALPALAAETHYVLDPNHTNIVWSANHFGFSNVFGKFAKTEGTLILDETKPENSKVSVTVTMDSIITGVPKLDEHLKSDAFFDTAKFATATFTSDKVEVTEPGKKAKVYGNLTLHGVTKPIVLDVTLNKIGDHPIAKKKTAGFSATTTIKRSDFGINYALPGVSDEIPLTINSEANVL